MLKMNDREAKMIYEHAVKEYPRECCGILLGNKEDGQVEEIYQAENTDGADRQNMHFLIDPLELYRAEVEAERKKMEIVGFYHSHADHPAKASEQDWSFMLPGYCYMIVSVVDGICKEIKSYRKPGFLSGICETEPDSDD